MKTITCTYVTKRLPSSPMGNPRYELTASNGPMAGHAIGTTRPNSSLAYGPVPNHEGKECVIEVHTTNGGKDYVESVTPA